MKVEYESAVIYIQDELCVFCEKKCGLFTKDWHILGWVTWEDKYVKANTIYTVKKKSPVQAHKTCMENAKVEPEAASED